MKLGRKAFTLIELMISITILSIMMMFLYKSYASLNLSNKIMKKEVMNIERFQKIKKIIYLDFSLALAKSVKIKSIDKKNDFVILQSSHSIHKRYNPYITYIVKEKKLYRLESVKKIEDYDIPIDSEFDIDYIGKIDIFNIYQSSETDKEIYFIHIDFIKFNDVKLKIKILNG